MSIDSLALAQNILLEAEPAELQAALDREREQMWPLMGQVETIAIAANASPIIQLSASAFDIRLVAFNGNFLVKATEQVLDALNPNWQNDPPGVPLEYVFKGEQALQSLTIHPATSQAGVLQVVKLVPLAPQVALWHDAYLAIAIINRLATADPLRSRLPLAEGMEIIKEAILNAFRSEDIRGSRR